MIEELLPFIWNFYNELGTELTIRTISEKPIIDFFPSPQMKLAFEERMSEDESYLQKPINENSFREQFNYDFGYGMVSSGYTVHLENILPAWRHRLVQQQKLIEEEFDISHLSTKENSLQYKDIEAQKIIFCDGVQSAQNQFFNKLPFRPATIERRPFVGFHPKHSSVGILNGMGTKGCSLAPYFAKQLADNIITKKAILPEADVSRFKKILSA
jgi:hypothetical protein